MRVFEFVIALVLIVTITRLIRDYLKNKTAHAKLAEKSDEKDARIQALEERVQTLERIVTDDKQSLKDKIDAL